MISPSRPIPFTLLLCCLPAASANEALAQDHPIVVLARDRHENFDSTLTDYRSRINTLVSIGIITDRLAPPQLIVASELASEIAWDQTEGLQVRMVGQRYVTALELRDEAADFGLDFGKPWFITTVPGDSLRVLGDLEIPGRAAVHPFAPGAEEYYEYAIGDTIVLSTQQRDINLIEVRVTPTTGDESLVVGSLWVDDAAGDVAAYQIRFVGKPLWADDSAPEGSDWANRILSLSATIEQGLWESRYWLPRRQDVQLNIDIPIFFNLAFPLVFKSEFGRYNVNSGEPIAWLAPDSSESEWLRQPGDSAYVELGMDRGDSRDATRVRVGEFQGEHWEIIRPPEDTLNAYANWREPMEAPQEQLDLPDADELERRAQELDPSITGEKLFVLGEVDRLTELIRYNRIEALGLSLGFRGALPRKAFWAAAGLVGLGIADLEPKARLGLRYDAPKARLHIDGYSELHLTASSLTDDRRAYGKSALRPFFLGRDDADYYRSSGLGITGGKRWGTVRGKAGIAAEYHNSVERNTQVAIPGIWQDSVFQTNPPATEGWYYRAALAATWFASSNWSRPGDSFELSAGLDGGSDFEDLDYLQPRLDFELKVRFGSSLAFALEGQGAWTAGHIPLQRIFGIGGLPTVRGHTFGTQRGDAYWATRTELSLRRKRLNTISPVVFADFGWAGDTNDWPSGGPTGDPLWSAGAGASFLNGIFRTDLVFRDSGAVWLELYFAGAL